MTNTHAGASPVDQPVALLPERWAPRDASWYNRPHVGGLAPRWHFVGADNMAVCGHPSLLALTDRHDGQPPAESFKCARCLAYLMRHNVRTAQRLEHHDATKPAGLGPSA